MTAVAPSDSPPQLIHACVLHTRLGPSRSSVQDRGRSRNIGKCSAALRSYSRPANWSPLLLTLGTFRCLATRLYERYCRSIGTPGTDLIASLDIVDAIQSLNARREKKYGRSNPIWSLNGRGLQDCYLRIVSLFYQPRW